MEGGGSEEHWSGVDGMLAVENFRVIVDLSVFVGLVIDGYHLYPVLDC